MIRNLTGTVLLVMFLLHGGALAGSFQISPVRLQLSVGQRVAVLTVRNDGDQASVIQLETMAWNQEDGQDRYSASKEILATPPLFKLPPGGSQIIRVGLLGEVDSRREQAYRIFLQEVPTENGSASTVRVALRFGIPVFIAPIAELTPPRLEWRLHAEDRMQWTIEAFNPADSHIQIADFSLADTAGQILAERKGMHYLLPGQRHRWPLALTRPLPDGASLKVVAHTDAGEIKADILSGR